MRPGSGPSVENAQVAQWVNGEHLEVERGTQGYSWLMQSAQVVHCVDDDCLCLLDVTRTNRALQKGLKRGFLSLTLSLATELQLHITLRQNGRNGLLVRSAIGTHDRIISVNWPWWPCRFHHSLRHHLATRLEIHDGDHVSTHLLTPTTLFILADPHDCAQDTGLRYQRPVSVADHAVDLP